jgi:alkylation response protein AidB-like acyl-CoA dehydrogenase
MLADLDGAWLAAYYAAWRLDEGLPADYEVAVAKAQASQAIREICFEGHEIHAGIGFMREYDLQLYYRRGKELELELGDTRFHRTAIARSLAAGEARFP